MYIADILKALFKETFHDKVIWLLAKSFGSFVSDLVSRMSFTGKTSDKVYCMLYHDSSFDVSLHYS